MPPRGPIRDSHAPTTPYDQSAFTLLFLLGTLGVIGALAPPPRSGGLPAPTSARLRLNPNFATADELTLLPNIGPARAAHIVAYRDAAPTRPAFSRPDDLDAVRTIGPKTVASVAPYLQFEPRPPVREVTP